MAIIGWVLFGSDESSARKVAAEIRAASIETGFFYVKNTNITRDLMDATDIARKKGATVIVITASGSPLAAAGHVHLSADHPEGYDRYSPMVSRLLHLMIIDILATTVALRVGSPKLQPLLQDMKNNLRNKRYA